ncbi:MAG: hypothetical protein MZV63_08380 [Marinilabiliales bacterium]|nr:hypothetical protein [Marinilabiliales bacterium]
MRMYNVFYDTDSWELLEASMPELEKLLEFLKINGTVVIEIGGHTDSDGSDEHNQSTVREASRFRKGVPRSKEELILTVSLHTVTGRHLRWLTTSHLPAKGLTGALRLPFFRKEPSNLAVNK